MVAGRVGLLSRVPTPPVQVRRQVQSKRRAWARDVALAALALSLAAAPAGAQSAARAPRAPRARPASALVFDGVTVIDVEHGSRLRDQRVVLVGHRIQAMGRRGDIPVPPGARLVDARGKYLSPGLWDLHFHAAAHGTLAQATTRPQLDAVYRQLIATGITGIRDPGSTIPLDTFRVWKQAIAAGRRVGPRLIVTGPSVEQADARCTREHQPPLCDAVHVYLARPEEAPHLVDSLQAAGADQLKIHNMSRPLWFALAAAARRAGLPFGGHFARADSVLPRTVDGLVGSDSGARILDHELWADVCGQEGDTVQSVAQCAAAAARLRRNRTWTAGGLGGASLPDALEQRALRYGMAEAAYATGRAWRPPSAAERRQLPTGAELARAISDSVRRGRSCARALLAYAADLPWVPGPDFGNFGTPVTGAHLSLLEPALCGVPPWWLLRAATLEPARALGLSDSLGTVAAGKVADLVLLDGDPLDDIWNVTKVAAVVANGRYYDRAALDRLLTEAGAEWRRVRALEDSTARQLQNPAQPEPPAHGEHP